jgi:hypothetical protein
VRCKSSAEIQTPFAAIVHPKINTGKESVANAEFGMRIWSALIRRRFTLA